MKKRVLAGWVGSAVVVGAYFAVTLDFAQPRDVTILVANIIGSGLIVASSLAKKDYPPVALNVVWATVAAIALLQILL